MNLSTHLANLVGSAEAMDLAERFGAWRDEMVLPRRRALRPGSDEQCDEDCPHQAAVVLWAQARVVFGEAAQELRFLRSLAAGVQDPAAKRLA